MKATFRTIALASLVATGLAIDSCQDAPCTTGVHIIVARASTEDPGQGILTNLVIDIFDTIPGSDSVAVDYPATLPDYPESEAKGVVAMNQMIIDYAEECPESKIVLMGYSQGAHVTGDVLCGSDNNDPLSSEYNATSKPRFSGRSFYSQGHCAKSLPSFKWVIQRTSSDFHST
jgi:hypothetical protein